MDRVAGPIMLALIVVSVALPTIAMAFGLSAALAALAVWLGVSVAIAAVWSGAVRRLRRRGHDCEGHRADQER